MFNSASSQGKERNGVFISEEICLFFNLNRKDTCTKLSKCHLPKENFDHLVSEVCRCQMVVFCFSKLLKKFAPD